MSGPERAEQKGSSTAKHVGVRAIPKNILREIRRFVIQNKGKLTYEQMSEEIAKRYGYILTPGQLYRLQLPKTKRVTIREDVLKMLEEEFGDPNEGLKQVTKLLKNMACKKPDWLRAAIDRLGGRELTFNEAVEEIRSIGYDDPQKVFQELAKLGYLQNLGNGKYRFYRFCKPDELALLMWLAGLP